MPHDELALKNRAADSAGSMLRAYERNFPFVAANKETLRAIREEIYAYAQKHPKEVAMHVRLWAEVCAEQSRYNRSSLGEICVRFEEKIFDLKAQWIQRERTVTEERLHPATRECIESLHVLFSRLGAGELTRRQYLSEIEKLARANGAWHDGDEDRSNVVEAFKAHAEAAGGLDGYAKFQGTKIGQAVKTIREKAAEALAVIADAKAKGIPSEAVVLHELEIEIGA